MSSATTTGLDCWVQKGKPTGTCEVTTAATQLGVERVLQGRRFTFFTSVGPVLGALYRTYKSPQLGAGSVAETVAEMLAGMLDRLALSFLGREDVAVA